MEILAYSLIIGFILGVGREWIKNKFNIGIFLMADKNEEFPGISFGFYLFFWWITLPAEVIIVFCYLVGLLIKLL